MTIASTARTNRRGLLVRALGFGLGLLTVGALGAASVAADRPAEATPARAPRTAHQALRQGQSPLVLQAISRSINAPVQSPNDAAISPISSTSPTKATNLTDGLDLADPADQPNQPNQPNESNQSNQETRLREVFWTAPERATADLLAANWGLGSRLYKLNPELQPGQKIAAGTQLKVYAINPETPTRSIGHPNRGRLRNGLPMPEGDAWRLRPNRRRAFGTHKTISTLLHAFEAYGERFPDAPKVRVGEIAKRRGGRVKPHASHRTGRDVDLGYIGIAKDDGEVRWKRMSKDTLDTEKSWFLIYELIKSGNVDTIFISSRLQKLLYREAKAQGLPTEELQRIFPRPHHENSTKAIIKHWRGHVNHMHVRFRCEDWNARCRGERRTGEPESTPEATPEALATATTVARADG
ncbi:MAG TPA: hypothetical protein ENK31_10040 [Nannocystis exedens]|nr:hypothetical protein [Nannocystis exedens]